MDSILHESFQCPTCASSNTQLVNLAYQHTIRRGHRFVTVSEFGKSIAPPGLKDELLGPSVIAFGFAIGGLFGIPSASDHLNLGWEWSTLDWQTVLISIVLGWCFGLLIAIPRVLFNVHELPSLIEDWEKLVICRRCGERFDRPSEETHK